MSATAVHNEQVWSHAGWINTAAHERMSMTTLHRLIFLQQNAALVGLMKGLSATKYKTEKKIYESVVQA